MKYAYKMHVIFKMRMFGWKWHLRYSFFNIFFIDSISDIIQTKGSGQATVKD